MEKILKDKTHGKKSSPSTCDGERRAFGPGLAIAGAEWQGWSTAAVECVNPCHVDLENLLGLADFSSPSRANTLPSFKLKFLSFTLCTLNFTSTAFPYNLEALLGFKLFNCIWTIPPLPAIKCVVPFPPPPTSRRPWRPPSSRFVTSFSPLSHRLDLTSQTFRTQSPQHPSSRFVTFLLSSRVRHPLLSTTPTSRRPSNFDDIPDLQNPVTPPPIFSICHLSLSLTEPDDLPIKSKKGSKKRAAAPDSNPPTVKDILEIGHGEAADGVLVDDDLNEPTMGEKLGSLNLLDNDRPESHDKEESSLDPKPPSADSISVNVDDTTGDLGHCKIHLTVESIWPFKLLQSLISIIQSRGAILACALPWLRSLLLQHASGILSQESSLSALNSLYQLIESKVSTFQSAL
ncbi:hypothetical protein C1H46_020796 [Malus baccata]|uniref:Small-subunit processome Utp12 domain-containing protein n=1 Tax=Malus baccata TaxID=106549 RepID=A0A540M4F6_MALBA|nr:hypothetical protein C1H46_020796 [Malus baccata]